MRSSYFSGDRKDVIQTFLKDVESQLDLNPFDEILYTINPYRLNKTKLSMRKAGEVIKRFLDAEKKSYLPKQAGGKMKYVISVKKEEFTKWKRDVESR